MVAGKKDACLHTVQRLVIVSCLECPLLCLRRVGVNWELSTMTLPLRVLKSVASLATFLRCRREGHSRLSVNSFTLQVLPWSRLTTNRAARLSTASVLSVFCSVFKEGERLRGRDRQTDRQRQRDRLCAVGVLFGVQRRRETERERQTDRQTATVLSLSLIHI